MKLTLNQTKEDTILLDESLNEAIINIYLTRNDILYFMEENLIIESDVDDSINKLTKIEDLSLKQLKYSELKFKVNKAHYNRIYGIIRSYVKYNGNMVVEITKEMDISKFKLCVKQL